jgi:hypothetical protein
MKILVLPLLLASLAARAADAPITVPDLTLEGTDGQAHPLRAGVSASKATVFEFFSAGCPVQHAHDEGLKQLVVQWQAAGVAFVAVDSEADAKLGDLAGEAKSRGYAFPILLDPGGKLAKAFGAKFCTTSVVVDAAGRVRYLGGIDSDAARLHKDSHPYLRDAVASVLAGRDPSPARTKSMGCCLQGW